MAGRSIFVILGWRLGVNNSESQFGPKSFTQNLSSLISQYFFMGRSEMKDNMISHITYISVRAHGTSKDEKQSLPV